MRPIVLWPDSVLSTVCEPIDRADSPEVQELFAEMVEAMHRARGIGLAANQLGVSKRLVAVDVGQGPLFFANPVILATAGAKTEMAEGCLSVPDIYGKVERYQDITVAYTDAKGFPALERYEPGSKVGHVLQHEIEHLDGKIFVQHLSRAKRDQAITHMHYVKMRRLEAAAPTGVKP